jgi:hypothetical protein
MVMKNVQVKVDLTEVNSKVVKEKGEEGVEGTNNVNIMPSQPSSSLPPTLQPEESGELGTLRGKVRHKW